MSPAQNKMYWREWSAAKKAGQLADADRHALHIRALGQAKSSKQFDNADLDKVLAAFRAISRPESLNAQVRQLEQPKTRLLHRIHDQIQILAIFVDHPLAYARKVLQDRFNTSFLEDLSADPNHVVDDIAYSELEMMRNTLNRCLSRLRQKTEMTEHEMHKQAKIPCFRTNCARCRVERQIAEHRAEQSRAREQAPAEPLSELEPF